MLPAVTRNRDYDRLKSFVPVAKLSDSPDILVIDPALPVSNSVRDLIVLAKARPGVLNFGSSGYGSATHLSAEWFKAKTGTDIVHVPYKGLSDALSGLPSREAVDGVRSDLEGAPAAGAARPAAPTRGEDGTTFRPESPTFRP